MEVAFYDLRNLKILAIAHLSHVPRIGETVCLDHVDPREGDTPQVRTVFDRYDISSAGSQKMY